MDIKDLKHEDTWMIILRFGGSKKIPHLCSFQRLYVFSTDDGFLECPVCTIWSTIAETSFPLAIAQADHPTWIWPRSSHPLLLYTAYKIRWLTFCLGKCLQFFLIETYTILKFTFWFWSKLPRLLCWDVFVVLWSTSIVFYINTTWGTKCTFAQE